MADNHLLDRNTGPPAMTDHSPGGDPALPHRWEPVADISSFSLELLREDAEFALYRAHPIDGRPSVLVVAAVDLDPPPSVLRRLEMEYELRGELGAAWAAPPLMRARHSGRVCLVLEDASSTPLSSLMGRRLEVGRFIPIAIGISRALEQVHRRSLIHQDVRPENILLDAAGHVRLTGFSIASRDLEQRPRPEAAELITCKLAYMAPEQTGRMDRSIDLRSDLYACGVMFYQMLAGVLPFQASDPMEWFHCHIARNPVPLGEQVSDLPPAVAAIVAKLMSKNPDDRYQTSAGLSADLLRCLMEWTSRGRVDAFDLGSQDAQSRLLAGDRLYGRDREVAELLAAFDRVKDSGTSELLMVSGCSGVGKSSLVRELKFHLLSAGGLFASGKFDQHKQDVPYSTVAEASLILIRGILTECDAELDRWRHDLREALGDEGRLMTGVMPELQAIVGEQPTIEELPPAEAQARFQAVFRRFLAVFARERQPLVLFLDDLQWLDPATLLLLEHVATHDEVRNLLLVGAFRDDEVDDAHPLRKFLKELHSADATVTELSLGPLDTQDTSRLVAGALRTDVAEVQELAGKVHAESGGNPLFATQYLTALIDEGLLWSAAGSKQWRWDIKLIKAKNLTGDVQDLVSARLARLSAELQSCLKRLAYFGSSAPTLVFAMLCEVEERDLHDMVLEAVYAGLLLRTESGYAFAHDRVRDAAYELVSERQRAAEHLQIGRMLVAGLTAKDLDDRIYDVVGQFAHAVPLIGGRQERQRVAELNVAAGRRSKAATAYMSARVYFAGASTLLVPDGWEACPALTFTVEVELGECEFLTGELEAADLRLTALAARSSTRSQRATVAWLRVTLYTAMDQNARAVDTGLLYLNEVGIVWSPQPNDDEVSAEHARLMAHIAHRSIAELADRPLMADAERRTTLDILMAVLPPAVYTDRNLVLLVLCRMANTSIEHGNTDASSVGYAYLGMYFGPAFGDWASGLSFAKLGLDLIETRGLGRFRARVYMTAGYHVMPWTTPLDDATFPLLQRTFDAATVAGDLNYVGYFWYCLISSQLARGHPLLEVQRSAEAGLAFVTRTKFGLLIDIISVQLAFIRSLRGLTHLLGGFDSDGFSEEAIQQRFARNTGLKMAAVMYWTRKLQASVFAGELEGALEAAEIAETMAPMTDGHLEAAEFHFHAALARAAAFETASEETRERYLTSVTQLKRQLDVWAANCPENWGDRTALVGAELARIEGRNWDAQQLYEQAIALSRQHGLVQNEGLALETASRFYRLRGFDAIAGSYRTEARRCYIRWGADGKVRRLIEQEPLAPTEGGGSPQARATGTGDGLLDLTTVLKVSQAVAGEIELDQLVRTLMAVAVENAGAERAVLILKRDQELWIEADARTIDENIVVQLQHSPARHPAVPQAITRYVMRTKTSVVLRDASLQDPFSNDEYVVQNGTRSVLCLPLIKQGVVVGSLYLENNLVTDAFTPARIAVLELVASQAAVSLEIAALYGDLRRENSERMRAEEDLQRSQAYLDEAQTLSRTGSFGWNTGTGEMFWSVETHSLLGASRSIRPTLEGALRTVHPDDVDMVRERLMAAARSCSSLEIEHRLLMPDGSVKHVHVVARPAVRAHEEVEYVGAIMDVTQRKRAEALTAGEKQLFEMIARSEPLTTILDALCQLFDETISGAMCSILVLDAKSGRLRHAAAPCLPRAYADAFDQVGTGLSGSPFLASTSVRRPAVTLDIETDPDWSGYRSFASAHGLRACWSWPIFSQERAILGTLAVYFREPHSPTAYHLDLAQRFVDIATIVINRTHVEEARLEDRVNERTRIARELHDTLLQGFQGLMLRFQTVQDLLPANPDHAKAALEEALDRADLAIAEGRDAVHELREATPVAGDLALALSELSVDLAGQRGGGEVSPAHEVRVEGKPYAVSPVIQDELFRIAREALRNAFAHANASRIETEITFAPEQLRIRIRDDGIGVHPTVLESGGRAGHWGLVGMRERAARIGAELAVRSKADVGTEVAILIPFFDSVASGAKSLPLEAIGSPEATR